MLSNRFIDTPRFFDYNDIYIRKSLFHDRGMFLTAAGRGPFEALRAKQRVSVNVLRPPFGRAEKSFQRISRRNVDVVEEGSRT